MKYDRIGVVLLNAVREQQMQFERQLQINEQQKGRVEDLQTQIEILKAAICQGNSPAAFCAKSKK